MQVEGRLLHVLVVRDAERHAQQLEVRELSHNHVPERARVAVRRGSSSSTRFLMPFFTLNKVSESANLKRGGSNL